MDIGGGEPSHRDVPSQGPARHGSAEAGISLAGGLRTSSIPVPDGRSRPGAQVRSAAGGVGGRLMGARARSVRLAVACALVVAGGTARGACPDPAAVIAARATADAQCPL